VKELPAFIEYKAESAPEPVWTFWGREKCLAAGRNQMQDVLPSLSHIHSASTSDMTHDTTLPKYNSMACCTDYRGGITNLRLHCDLHTKLQVPYTLYSWRKSKRKGKGTDKGNMYNMMAYRQSGSTAPHILNLGTRWR
jgi:ligand-binding SRPBCC domain-containing protein